MKLMNSYLARFDLEPSLINPLQESRFRSSLDAVAATFAGFEEKVIAAGPAMQDDFWFAPDDYRAKFRPYVVKDGVLQIPVKGVLLHDFAYQYFDYATGYPYIKKAVERGMGDPEVRALAFIIDSPGGEVAGNFDLNDYIYAQRGKKPIAAFAHECAYSAAYSIFSTADKGSRFVSRTGGVGSIGVVTAHLDVSEAMTEMGYKLTWIFFGAHKVDGNAYEPLKPAVKKRIQSRIDELGGIFVSTVARNLGVDEEVIRETEAATFTASEAVSIGLADKIGSFDDSLATFVASLDENEEDENMANESNTVSAADHAKAIENAKAEGKAEGLKEGANAQRARISTILGSENAKKRPTAAMQVAMKTDMEVGAADEFLAAMPEEKPAATTEQPKNETANGFVQQMNAGGNPPLGKPDSEGAKANSGDDDDFDNRYERAMGSVFGSKKKMAAI